MVTIGSLKEGAGVGEIGRNYKFIYLYISRQDLDKVDTSQTKLIDLANTTYINPDRQINPHISQDKKVLENTTSPSPEPTAPPIQAVQLTSVEAQICSYAWECEIALHVARCESGLDYQAGYSGPDSNGYYYAGTFQISSLHIGRFLARGLDYWIHGEQLEWNLEIAYEIWTERYWSAWSCY